MVASVSTVIPCYRCFDTIRRAVDSVAKQTLRPAEIILIDDGSKDDTLKVLFQLQCDYGQDWIKVIALEDNRGVSVARNTGWDAASHPYIAFLDADEAWHPRKIEIQYTWMESHPAVALTGHPRDQVRSETFVSALPENCQTWPISRRDLLLTNRLPTSSVMLRRSLPHRFEPGKRRSEDYLLWLQIVLGGYSAWQLEFPLAHLYKASFGEEGLSGDLWKMEQGELDTYWRLCRDSSISLITCAWLMPLSLAKHLRRLFIVRVARGVSWQ